MTKNLKIILFVLALISIGFSLAFYFDLWPLAKKEETKSETPEINLSQETIQELNSGFSSLTSGSCLILDDQYCGSGKLIYDNNNQPIGLGFKLPKGNKIYSPFKGKMESTDTKVQIEGILYRASVLLDVTKDDWSLQETRTIFAALGYHQLPEANKETFAKGDVFALTRDSVVDPKLGDYNLILTFRVFSLKTNNWYTDLNLLRQYFKNIQD